MRRTIEYSDQDHELLEYFERHLDMLTNMVEEMFFENQEALLSPTMRAMLLDRSREVAEYHEKFRHKLCVDVSQLPPSDEH